MKIKYSEADSLGLICGQSVEEYCRKAQEFHGGHLAPGLIIAGYMVDLATRSLPPDILFEVICETGSCIPDAVQLLTPCSIGNQWMKIIDVGRYAMTFYDKYTGRGVRVSLDTRKLEKWPVVKEWFLKLKPKHDQDTDLLLGQVIEAGTGILRIEDIVVMPEYLGKKKKTVGICPVCNEAFRANEGAICPACKGNILPYTAETEQMKTARQ